MPRLVRFHKKVRGLPRSKRDYSVEHSCLSKIRYRTWAEAEAKIQFHIAENITNGQPQRSSGLSAYGCDHCGGWHIGHSRGPLLDPCYEPTKGGV